MPDKVKGFSRTGEIPRIESEPRHDTETPALPQLTDEHLLHDSGTTGVMRVVDVEDASTLGEDDAPTVQGAQHA
jgi:hypothetical protein